jgi:hypothetical protein
MKGKTVRMPEARLRNMGEVVDHAIASAKTTAPMHPGVACRVVSDMCAFIRVLTRILVDTQRTLIKLCVTFVLILGRTDML